MSKKSVTQRVAESIWLKVLSDHRHYFKKPWEIFYLKKLKQAKFTKLGALKMDSVGSMIDQEWPTLYEVWKERMNVEDNA